MLNLLPGRSTVLLRPGHSTLESTLHSDSTFDEARAHKEDIAQKETRKFNKKLSILRAVHNTVSRQGFKRSKGSRRIAASKYVRKDPNGEVLGAPFPKYLRGARRNRPHTNQGPRTPREYQVTPEDLAQRDPIILSRQENIVLTDDQKELLRKSRKFVPTPRGPIDEKGQYVSFLRYRESLRWKWFFLKNEDPNNIEDHYVSRPWDVRTEKRAPIATDCPELEAYFAGIERDLKDPTLRRKIKSNLNENQWKFFKEVQEDYLRRGLRVRREDKGPRAVIVDKDNEDDRIQEELSNETYYTETDHDPKEEFINQIRQWADDALENEEINEKQHHFVTNIDSTNLSKIKPLYKTHKKQEDGT